MSETGDPKRPLREWHRLFMYKPDAQKYKDEVGFFSTGSWMTKKGGYWIVSYMRRSPYMAGDCENVEVGR